MSISISLQKQSWPYAMGMALFVHLLILVLLCVQFISSSASKSASPTVMQAVMLPASQLQLSPVLPKLVEVQETEPLKETVEKILPQPEVSSKLAKKVEKTPETFSSVPAYAGNSSDPKGEDAYPRPSQKNPSTAAPTEVKEISLAKPTAMPSSAPMPSGGTNANNQELDRYRALIAASIGRYWRVPPNLNPNLQALVQVRLAPGGVVLDVHLLQSSGNAMLDQSAMLAVERASPLPVPTEVALFDQFRQIILKVRPEGVITT